MFKPISIIYCIFVLWYQGKVKLSQLRSADLVKF